jgi:2-oxoacid:acceptor oxidoreductase delta subunit (pyruvate/2-ketoisovalerate family)
MSALRGYRDLPAGGVVRSADAPTMRTGGWRSGLRPRADLDVCVNCLLCWVYCPDSAVLVSDGIFEGFDLDSCKGCEICDEMCPVNAIAMVPDVDD